MSLYAASNPMTPQLADKRMAVLSHLAVWWCCCSRCLVLTFLVMHTNEAGASGG